jgi:myo-inositol-1(or 4)-monophosphatase
MPLQDLLACALEAATAGATELQAKFRGTLTINTKSSEADYVTDADLASETAVREVIKRLRPNDSISGEEFATDAGIQAEYRWSIDPLDGTVNFARGLDHYAVSVAAQHIDSGDWVVGVVIAPELDDTYVAVRGEGSWRIRKGHKTGLTGPPKAREAKILATGFSYLAAKRAEEFETLTKLMPRFVDVRRFGSAALDICHVAEGTIDAYYQVDIKEHDWAAAMLIAEEAGLNIKRPTAIDDLALVNFEL